MQQVSGALKSLVAKFAYVSLLINSHCFHMYHKEKIQGENYNHDVIRPAPSVHLSLKLTRHLTYPAHGLGYNYVKILISFLPRIGKINCQK